MEKIKNKLIKIERDVKEKLIKKIIRDCDQQYLDDVKSYKLNMEKFIKRNKQNINIERAKLMLKLSNEAIKKVNAMEY